MNNPMSSGDESSPSLGGFRYGIGISIGVLTLVIIMTLISYFCTRARLNFEQSTRPASVVMITVDGDPAISGQPRGLNDDVLRSFPKLLYAQAKLHLRDNNRAGSASSSCSICLADYADSDELRLLPDCGHIFHINCVDLWLRQHPTCPICRSSPIPTPLTTPLAEVAPLAAAAPAATATAAR
ncbi:RING-H2 finger protein ATL70 [Morus notabilis]|uniref:RING-type E3 ubiquitin transferase n=1 Tax=Morus notabilis TaxID=981085 RepID=W9QTC9_9ROSA|nr:RING-H2 finger protein ATL70 [Morus notabilis]EXB39583.1 RING-H2 finger protein ATL70 [Morus notabilis]